MVGESLPAVAYSRSVQDGPDLTATARSLTEHVESMLGGTAGAILHYGSRVQGRAASPDSAYDFFVIVDSYRRAYRALAAHGAARRSGRLAVALAWVLPPNALSIRLRVGSAEHEAKCVLLSIRHFRRECGPGARDHFVRARLCQVVALAWFRDEASRAAIHHGLDAIREGSFDWVRSWLPPRFDVSQYCRSLLVVSLAHEIRPELRDHADTLLRAQRQALLRIYQPVLEGLRRRGRLESDGNAFVQGRAPGWRVRLRVGVYFRVSKMRMALRLLKHPFLYDGWLNYLLQKIDRSTGQKIVLTERERRWPLIFLWPRAFRYLRSRPQLER
jgi:hypothetical protein